MDVTVNGIDLELLADRAVFWPEPKILFVADTHFGKEATFRRSGIAVPKGSTAGTLATIASLVRHTSAERLVLLGDMFHSRLSLSSDVVDDLDRFFLAHPHLRFTLVRGNHDRHLKELPRHWGVEIVREGYRIESIALAHHPEQEYSECDLVLCGHIHPAYRLQLVGESPMRLPCFWLSRKQLVLPAIGEFTGTHVVKPSATDRVWTVASGSVIELSQSVFK